MKQHRKDTTVRCSEGADCPECRGYGYMVFSTDGAKHHEPFELQAVDVCAEDCFGRERGDDAAAEAFTRDLEAHDQHAIECAITLLLRSDDPDDPHREEILDIIRRAEEEWL